MSSPTSLLQAERPDTKDPYKTKRNESHMRISKRHFFFALCYLILCPFALFGFVSPIYPKDDIEQKIDSIIGTKSPIVFVGFSAKGYEDPLKLESQVEDILDQYLSTHSPEDLIVVCGATRQGIGMCYKPATERSISTLGIVSDLVSEEDISPFCNSVVIVPSLDWKVLNHEGKSYMVYSASRNKGCLFALGGGEVAESEIKQAYEEGIPVKKFSFRPASKK